METPVVKSRGRPKKRPREELSTRNDKHFGVDNGKGKEDAENTGNPRKRGRPPKKTAVEIKGEVMIGRYVLEEFGNGVFLGKIVSYDNGLYRVDYEDGDSEDLDNGELRVFVISDEREKFVGELLERKKRLDEAIDKRMGVKLKDESENGVKSKDKLENGVKLKDVVKNMGVVEVVFALEKVDPEKERVRVTRGSNRNAKNDVGNVEVAALSDSHAGSDIDKNNDDDYCFEDENEDNEEDDDSSSASMEYGQDWETRAETEIPDFPPPELPPSSGTVGVPKEYLSNLFSVYGFLRTFSIHLFLSPFTLDDLVGCLNCKVPNTLLDAIHVALLRALRRHLEGINPEESQLAGKCLRSIDWDLLDYLTWPVYLFHYLTVMGHLDGKEWKGFYVDIIDKDYCSLSIGTKLSVLQILCDDSLDTEEIRSEIDRREESEVGVDPDVTSSHHIESGTRTMYPRSSKTFAGEWAVENGVTGSSKSDAHHSDLNDVGEDGNVDECRLCGMEGILVCCDGCPSAYHSRCIGVNKLSIPDGKWFCPECTISKIGPPIITGTSLRCAEVFGVDPYAQLFMGTCNHLLVLKVSIKASSFVKYYNCNDIPKVISALISSPNHALSYLEICQSISKYWGLPEVVLPAHIMNQASTLLLNKDENGLSLQSHLCHEQTVPDKTGNETCASSVGESFIIGNASGLGNDEVLLNPGSDCTSFGAPLQSYSKSMEITAGVSTAMKQNTISMGENMSGHNNGIILPETPYMRVRDDRNKALARSAQKNITVSYMGSVFKPFAYINNYVHGAFAALAAANFEGLSSDENQATGLHSTDDRKAMAANISLQVKAFCSAADRFFWPSTEKKLVEIPRERCSWCFHCKAPVISKKACLLNQAALNATRAEMRFISALRLVKVVESGLYGIASYTLYMEESLRGLLIGSFRSSSYREQWRKKVEQASTCSEMKPLLLDLERNICAITISSEWTKLVDNWRDDSSLPQSSAASGSTQKRGPGKRKKHHASLKVDAGDSDSHESIWWRGGKLAKLVFQRGTLPRGILRKGARQGGSRRHPGISYADGSDVPKRSRQLLWRAAVEMAKNASQLALLARYLYQNIKWSDLVRPEQIPGEGKGTETDALAFRNARICDKRILENKIMYGVVFGQQKHLSSRLMKSIIEKEESKDGEEKYWLLETRVPLYLIKEYEENADKYTTDLLEPSVKLDRYSKNQRRQLKASRKEIFVYLARKKQGLTTCPCASCRGDVLIEQSVTCNSCEGFCHKTCTLSSTERTSDDVEFRVTCRQCSNSKIHPHPNISAESPTSPLPMQQEFQNTSAVIKSGKLKSSVQQLGNSMAKDSHSKKKSSKSSKMKLSNATSDSLSEKKPSKSSKKNISGVIWKKDDEDGYKFLMNNIIHRSSTEGLTLTPKCQLCLKPYSPYLMYIRCEECECWHHADAVNIDESKLPNIVGYKCCRCRKMKILTCPYGDIKKPEVPITDVKKPEIRKLRINGPKMGGPKSNSGSEAISDQMESLPSTPMSLMEIEQDSLISQNNPLEVDCEWNPSLPGPQKLPVRRLVKNEKYENGLTWPGPDLSYAHLPTPVEHQKLPVRRYMKNEKVDNGLTWPDLSSSQLPKPVENQKLPVRRHMMNELDTNGLTWPDLSSAQIPTSFEPDNFPDPNLSWDITPGVPDNPNYENPGFEPQTYFSFTELLETDNSNTQLEIVDDATREAWQELPCENSQNGFIEQCKVTSFDDFVPKSSIEPKLDILCEVCQESSPELACIICGTWFHRHCLPWEDDEEGAVIQVDNWSCGHCNEFGAS